MDLYTRNIASWKKKGVKYVDFRFSDTHATFHHVTVPINQVDRSMLEAGKMFDGSSIPGWRPIESSDMKLIADLDTAYVDPFISEPTLSLICNVQHPDSTEYNRCPRTIAQKSIDYMKSTKIADGTILGPEPEFFIFDSVQWNTDPHASMFKISSQEGPWSNADEMDMQNPGHRPRLKGGYFPLAPTDSLIEIRNEICETLPKFGITPEVHHHEVAAAGQCEIGSRGDNPVRRADMNQLFKYVVYNVAHDYGKTATFMPKPLANDNGSGMHVHISLNKNGKPLFPGKLFGGLSQLALYFVGGVLKHSRTLNAFLNPSTNSYKRLVPGFEAPTILAYSERNRSASIRIPHTNNVHARRIEVRYPDPTANPYIGFAALLVAGLDGILKKIEPGEPSNFNLYDSKKSKKLKTTCATLEEALRALESDHKFLTDSGVFDDDMIASYIELKMEEVNRFRGAPHPIEFDMYYSR